MKITLSSAFLGVIHYRMVAVGCVVAIGLALGGCHIKPHNQWMRGAGSYSLIGEGVTYKYSTMDFTCDGRSCAFVVLAGGSGESYHGGEGKYSAEMIRGDGKRVSFSCDLQDGQNATFAIDGQSFDLAHGGLLLIAADTNPARVRQFAMDAAQLRSSVDPSRFVGLLKSDARFESFLQACKTSNQ